jgi:3-methyladenine DNA glycosylase AlkC
MGREIKKCGCGSQVRASQLLESLKFDSSLYVRKSVANHLNDIAKDHPKIVTETIKRWAKEVPSDYENEFRFIVHRALRTLIKNGDPQALESCGYSVARQRAELFRIEI